MSQDFSSCFVRFSASFGAEHCSSSVKSVFLLVFGFTFALGLCVSGLRCLVPALAAQSVQFQQSLVVESASAVTVFPAPAMALQGVWSQSFVSSLL